jgi:WD40 repeat protein
VHNILASTSFSGTSVVWDLRRQKPVISFTDPTSRRRCSALQWNPDVATQLIVASDDDRSPSLQVPYLVATGPPFYQHVPLFLSIDNIHLMNFIFVLVRSFVLCFGM